MVNRRQHPRIEYRQKVEIKLYSVEGHPELTDKMIIGHTADISEGGLGIRIDKQIPVGTAVKLRIFVVDPPSAFLQQGTVRWALQEEGGWRCFVGVEFTGSSPEHMEEWLRLVRHIAFHKGEEPKSG